MVRPIEFDKEVVLKKAMETFWQNGYESTSMLDLIEATGMTSRSMYNVFGSKNGLFKAVLKTYYKEGCGPLFTELQAGKGSKAIRTFFQAVTSVKPLNGCLYVNTLSDQNGVEKDCLEIVKKYFKKLESAFTSKLICAKKNEGFTGEPELRARQLVTFLQGLTVYSKMNFSLNEQKRTVEDFLRLIGI